MNYGLSIPFDGLSLSNHMAAIDAAAGAGYTDLWSSEVNGADAFTPLALAAAKHPELRLGTAIVPAFTRSPALMAMNAASLADATGSQVLLGVGASSDVIVQRWNGVPFTDPYGRVRDVAGFLNRAFTGERIDMETRSFTINGFRLGRIPQKRPKVLIAALRPGMLRLAGRSSDGAILNWLSPADVAKVVPYVQEGRENAPEIVARLFVIVSRDIDRVREHAKRAIAAYLNVEVYAKYQQWLGRGPVLEDMWSAWRSGDRKAALAAIPDSLVDELFIHGDAATCRSRVEEYVANGVTTPMLAITNLDGDPVDMIAPLGRRTTSGADARPERATATLGAPGADRTAAPAPDDIVAQDRARWSELGWPEPVAMGAFMSLLRTQDEVVSRARSVLQKVGLSITEHAALVFLAMSPDNRRPLSKIAERLLIGAGRCSYLIDRLESEDWVRRRPHPSDGRATLAILTEAGKEKAMEATQALARSRYGFGTATDETLNAVTGVLAEVRQA